MGSVAVYALAALSAKRWLMPPQGGFVNFAASDHHLLLLGAGLVSVGACFAILLLLPRWQPVARLVKQSRASVETDA